MSTNSPAPLEGVVEEALHLRRSPRLLAAAREPAANTAPATTGARPRNLTDSPAALDDAADDVSDVRPQAVVVRSRRTTTGVAAGRRAAGGGVGGGRQQTTSAAAANTTARQRVGSGPRFSVPEMESMLTSIEQYLPMGPEEWEAVADSHSLEFPNREAQSLRRKFQALYNVRLPTGDPLCPPHVRRAKRIRYLIEERADASNLTGTGADLGFPTAEDDVEGNRQEEEQRNDDDDDAGNVGHLNATDSPQEPVEERAAAENAVNTQRILFGEPTARRSRDNVPRFVPRPLVSRTPSSIGGSTNNNNNNTRTTTGEDDVPSSSINRRREELHELMMTNMMARMEREDTDREERRTAATQQHMQQQLAMQQQQQLTMAMVTGMMAVVSALNPAAAAATIAAASAASIAAGPPAAAQTSSTPAHANNNQDNDEESDANIN
jgi:hypothetical protein